MDRQGDGQGQEAGGDLLEDRQIGQERLPGTTEPLLVRDAAQAHHAQLAEQVAGEFVILLEPAGRWSDPLGHELPDGPDDVALVVGQAEVAVHRREPTSGGYRHGPLTVCGYPLRMRLYSSLSREIEAVIPADGRTVKIYSCGPTVYRQIHLGNFRSFMLGDLIRRVARLEGLEAYLVMNITDVGHMTDEVTDTGRDKMEVAE